MLSGQWEESKSSRPPTRVYTTRTLLKGHQELRPPDAYVVLCEYTLISARVKNVISNYQVTTVNLQGDSSMIRSSFSATSPLCSVTCAPCSQYHLPRKYSGPLQQHNSVAAQSVPPLWELYFMSQWPQLKSQDGKIRHLHQQQRFSQELDNTCICIHRKRTFGTKGESSVLH